MLHAKQQPITLDIDLLGIPSGQSALNPRNQKIKLQLALNKTILIDTHIDDIRPE